MSQNFAKTSKYNPNFLAGFTLVEILVSVAIMSFIVAGIFAVFYVGETTWHQDMGLVDLQQAARLAMDGMTREIRQSKSESPSRVMSISADKSGITFYIPGYSDPIIYSLGNNQVVREHPINITKILANNAGSLSFCLWDGVDCCDPASENCSNLKVVQIQLGVTKTVRGRLLSFSLTEKVRLRNE